MIDSVLIIRSPMLDISSYKSLKNKKNNGIIPDYVDKFLYKLRYFYYEYCLINFKERCSYSCMLVGIIFRKCLSSNLKILY